MSGHVSSSLWSNVSMVASVLDCSLYGKSESVWMTDWVSHWVREWQGHLLSCSGQLKTITKTMIFGKHPQRAILETCDLTLDSFKNIPARAFFSQKRLMELPSIGKKGQLSIESFWSPAAKRWREQYKSVPFVLLWQFRVLPIFFLFHGWALSIKFPLDIRYKLLKPNISLIGLQELPQIRNFRKRYFENKNPALLNREVRKKKHSVGL